MYPCFVSIIVNDDQQNAIILVYLFIPNQLYMFRAMCSPIVRSTWLYLQLLVLSTDTAAGWCHGWDGKMELTYGHQLYMFRAMCSPIFRSTWLYLQFLVLSTDTAAGWCHGWDGKEFHLVHDTGRQPHRWTISEDVNTVKCSWRWAKTSPKTCGANWVQINKPKSWICWSSITNYTNNSRTLKYQN